MKRIFVVLLVLVIASVGLFATTGAQVTILGSIEETPENSGLRVTTDTETLSNFDATFLAADSEISLDVGELNGTQQTNGQFSLLVRKLTNSGVTIRVTANPLLNTEETRSIGYILTSATSEFGGSGTTGSSSGNSIFVSGSKATNTTDGTSGTADYVVPAANAGSILQHQNIFTFYIQSDTAAPMGNYGGNVTFEFVNQG